MKKKIYLANNLHLYRRNVKFCYVEVPFDDALLFLYMEQPNEPEHLFEKRENLIRLQNAFASLTEEEKNFRKNEKFLVVEIGFFQQ